MGNDRLEDENRRDDGTKIWLGVMDCDDVKWDKLARNPMVEFRGTD
jgi:hypothetical protein